MCTGEGSRGGSGGGGKEGMDVKGVGGIVEELVEVGAVRE